MESKTVADLEEAYICTRASALSSRNGEFARQFTGFGGQSLRRLTVNLCPRSCGVVRTSARRFYRPLTLGSSRSRVPGCRSQPRPGKFVVSHGFALSAIDSHEHYWDHLIGSWLVASPCRDQGLLGAAALGILRGLGGRAEAGLSRRASASSPDPSVRR